MTKQQICAVQGSIALTHDELPSDGAPWGWGQQSQVNYTHYYQQQWWDSLHLSHRFLVQVVNYLARLGRLETAVMANK
jgi:hypothetical protein